MAWFVIADLQYELTITHSSTASTCVLRLFYNGHCGEMVRDLAGYWDRQKLITSHPFASMVKEAVSRLRKTVHKPEEGLSTPQKSTPLSLTKLLKEAKVLKPLLAPVEGLAWGAFSYEEGTFIERIDCNKIIRTDDEAHRQARDAGYRIDSRGRVLERPT